MMLGFTSAFLSQVSGAYLGTMFRRKFSAKIDFIANQGSAYLGTMFRREFLANHMSIATHTLPNPLSFFRGMCLARLAALQSTQLFARFRRALYTQARACNFCHVQAFVAKWFDLVKPVLLTRGQQFRDEYKFYDFKGEGISTVLVPSTLQFLIIMGIATKMLAVINPAPAQVHSATDIDFSGNNTGDAVNAAGGGDNQGHANYLSLVPYLFLLPGEQGYSLFSAIYQITDRQHPYYTFFLPARKAEERG